MTSLITERLTLRPYQETDFEAFAKMHADPLLKANTHAKAMNRLQARDLFDGYVSAFKKDGFGMLNMRRTDSDQDVGECGLWYRDDAGGYTLRYTIRKEHWNLGYSIEAVRAVLADAFENKGLDRIQAIAMNHNVRSVKVLQRAGFIQTDNTFRDVQGFLRFDLTKSHWVTVSSQIAAD
ncbi:MAG: GNAT family N-acetyltransferase [Rhodospirillales bacterium]|nr:GNAT family N-acetyltransferase [Rhodospirillales bacterium]